MSRQPAPRPAALAAALALAALAAPVAGCREERPMSAAIADRVIAAAQNPRPTHIVSASQLTMTMALPGADALTMRVALDAEQWTRDAQHVRSEMTTRLSLDAGGAVDGPAAMIAGLFASLGDEGYRSTTVRNGSLVSSHETMMNTFSSIDLAELPADAQSPTQAETADMIRKIVRDIAAGYLLNPLADREVAGRPAFALAIVPRNADAPRPVFYALRIQNGELVVDKETYDVLALEGEGFIDLGAAAAQVRAEGADGPMAGMGRAFEGGFGGRPIPVAYRMTVTAIEVDPELPDALFDFSPPEGATRIDVLALATAGAAAATADAAGDGEESVAMGTAVAEAAATAMASMDLDGASEDAPPGAAASAESALAAGALAPFAPGAGFPVLVPGYVPSGCVVTGSGRLPDAASVAEPARLVWIALTCPDGALRIEQKGAGDAALSLDEDAAERLTAMVGGERVPYLRRADGSGAVLVENLGGTSVKVSGDRDVAELVRIAESMR